MTPRRTTARVAGILYLVVIVANIFAELIVPAIVVIPGNASATATNIVQYETLYRLGGAAFLIMFACDIAVAILLYELFLPAGRILSLISAVFRLAQTAILSANLVNYFGAVLSVKSGHAQAMVLFESELHAYSFYVARVFFGIHCALIGYLIIRSALIPRTIGALMSISGVAYIVHSLSAIVAPAVGATLYMWMAAMTTIGELALMLWLLFNDVNGAGEQPE